MHLREACRRANRNEHPTTTTSTGFRPKPNDRVPRTFIFVMSPSSRERDRRAKPVLLESESWVASTYSVVAAPKQEVPERINYSVIASGPHPCN